MKSFTAILVLLCVFSAVSSRHTTLKYFNLFEAWKITHNKNYATALEEAQKYETFVNNYQQIQAFNEEDNGATLALNQFADMTSEEFGAHIQCLSTSTLSSIEKLPKIPHIENSELPSSVNWTAAGAVTSVKNQETCGGCWAFAAAASMEGYNFLKNSKLEDLSMQQLIDCVPNCEGCNGCDNLYNALVYTSQKGIELLTDYPFTGASGTCKYSKSDVAATNQGYSAVTPKSVTALQTAIAQQPTIVGIQANQLVFQFYQGGVIKTLCGDQVDHAVTATGYATIDGTLAFIIKNSWGPTWGNAGYVYIAADGTANGGNGVCGVLSGPVYPTQV